MKDKSISADLSLMAKVPPNTAIIPPMKDSGRMVNFMEKALLPGVMDLHILDNTSTAKSMAQDDLYIHQGKYTMENGAMANKMAREYYTMLTKTY